MIWSVIDLDSLIRREYSLLSKNIMLWSDLTSYNLTRVSRISFAVFSSATLDNTEFASGRCRLAIALSSISFYLSLVNPVGLLSIASKQLSFLRIAFIFISTGNNYSHWTSQSQILLPYLPRSISLLNQFSLFTMNSTVYVSNTIYLHRIWNKSNIHW